MSTDEDKNVIPINPGPGMSQRDLSLDRRARGRPHGTAGSAIEIRVDGKMAMLMRGELTIEDMDDEELARMQFKDKNGRFAGRPPGIIPRDLANRMRDELLSRAHALFNKDLIAAVGTLGAIAQDPGAKHADRLKAADLIINRVMGKTPDKIELSGQATYQVLLANITRGPRPAKPEDAPPSVDPVG